MDLTSAQRKLVFAVVVLVLAALGAFLIIPNTLGRGSNSGHGRAVGLSTPLSSTAPSPGPASQPATSGVGSPPQPGAGPDIYSWLPFSQAGLTAAADLVHKFAAAYASYTYTQTTDSYERQFSGLATTQLATVLARGYATLAVAVALIPLGTAFTFPCVTSMLSRVISSRERGLYMGVQQTFSGLARVIVPLWAGYSYDHLGKTVPMFTSAALVFATIVLGFGIDDGRKAAVPVASP